MDGIAPTSDGDALLSLLLGDAATGAAASPPSTGSAASLTRLVAAGEYAAVLAEPAALRLLNEADTASSSVTERARAYLLDEQVGGTSKDRAEAVLAVGAAALSLFAHANWTGAPVTRLLASSWRSAAFCC